MQVVKRGEHTFQMGIHCAFCRQAGGEGGMLAVQRNAGALFGQAQGVTTYPHGCT